MADNEEIFETEKTKSQTIIEKTPIKKSNPKKTPKEVATPLPPLNLKKIGNKCPKKTEIAETEMRSACSEIMKVSETRNLT